MTANATLAPLFQTLKVYADNANGIGTKIKAATSGADDAAKVVLSSSDDKVIKTWREADNSLREQIKAAEAKIAEAKAAAEARAKEIVLADAGGADFNVEDATAEFLKARQDATSIRKTLLQLLGGDEQALQSAYEEFGITEIVSIRGTGGTSRGSNGVLKPRLVSAEVDGEDVIPATFTVLSKTLGQPLDVVKAAAFKAADTEDLRTRAGDEITFSIDTKDGVKSVTIVPKAPATKSEDEDTDSK